MDHFTENGSNATITAKQSTCNDGLDLLRMLLILCMSMGLKVSLWKGDISKAYMRCPRRPQDSEFSAVVWKDFGVTKISELLSMPFGSAGSVHAFHRVANVFIAVLRQLFFIMSGKYVDDFFGLTKAGQKNTGSQILTTLSHLFGFPVDLRKNQHLVERMSVLGCKVFLDLAKLADTIFIDEEKKLRWIFDLWVVVKTGKLCPSLASKIVGRLTWTTTSTMGKSGRAFLRPLHAQSRQPMANNTASVWLMEACAWWIWYLLEAPSTTLTLEHWHDHNIVRSWSDAAGKTRRVAAVIGLVVDGKYTFLYTTWTCTDELWEQLLVRANDQIAPQELLSVILTLHTFKHLLKGKWWLHWGDADGVTRMLLRGSASVGAGDMNMITARFWQDVVLTQCSFYMHRVSIHCNIADGPSRDFFEQMEQLNATYVDPIMPKWIGKIWQPLTIPTYVDEWCENAFGA